MHNHRAWAKALLSSYTSSILQTETSNNHFSLIRVPRMKIYSPSQNVTKYLIPLVNMEEIMTLQVHWQLSQSMCQYSLRDKRKERLEQCTEHGPLMRTWPWLLLSVEMLYVTLENTYEINLNIRNSLQIKKSEHNYLKVRHSLTLCTPKPFKGNNIY